MVLGVLGGCAQNGGGGISPRRIRYTFGQVGTEYLGVLEFAATLVFLSDCTSVLAYSVPHGSTSTSLAQRLVVGGRVGMTVQSICLTVSCCVMS